MKPIITKIDLVDYITRVENQKECLKFSLWFSDEEKIRVARIFDELLNLAYTSLAKDYAVNLPTIL